MKPDTVWTIFCWVQLTDFHSEPLYRMSRGKLEKKAKIQGGIYDIIFPSDYKAREAVCNFLPPLFTPYSFCLGQVSKPRIHLYFYFRGVCSLVGSFLFRSFAVVCCLSPLETKHVVEFSRTPLYNSNNIPTREGPVLLSHHHPTFALDPRCTECLSFQFIENIIMAFIEVPSHDS